MDTSTLLHEFAKSQNIAPHVVDAFLQAYKQANTLEEVENLPHDLQTHYPYITRMPEPLKSFVQENIYFDRHEVIKLDTIVDFLYDEMHALIDSEDTYIDEVGFETLVAKSIEDADALESLKAVARQLIANKFGSVKMDW